MQAPTVQTGRYLFTAMDEDFSGVVQQDQVEVAVRVGEMSHKVSHVPFEWGEGYGLVDRDDVVDAVAELRGDGAPNVAILEVYVNDRQVAAQEIDMNADPNGPVFVEDGISYGCDTYTTSGGVEARPNFHAVTVPAGQEVDTPFATELDPLGGTGGGESVPVTMTSALTSGDEYALTDETLTPQKPGLYVSERTYEGEDGSQYREWVVVEALAEDTAPSEPAPGEDETPAPDAPSGDEGDHTVPEKVETGGLALGGLGGATALVALRRRSGLA